MERAPFTFQFHDALDASTAKAWQARRPVLTHLNADSSWLLQLPCPPDHFQRTGRSRYNIVIDPWFQGPQVDFAAWFSKQWHATKSRIQTFQELEDRLVKLESISLAREIGHEAHELADARKSSHNSMIDAVVISHEFTDHCHKETLLELNPSTPVFAAKEAVTLVKSWRHFTTVSEIPVFAPPDRDRQKYSAGSLPDWLGVSRIVNKSDSVYLHSAILLTFQLDHSISHNGTRIDGENKALLEAVIYTPHGTQAQDLRRIHSTSPSITVLALLHGLHEVNLTPFSRLNLGGHNGLKAQRTCKAKYWISTHDEDKNGTGLVALLLKRKPVSLHEAVERERQELKQEQQKRQEQQGQEIQLRSSYSVNATQMIVAELANGESILLE